MPLKIISGIWILSEYSHRQERTETGRSVLGEMQVSQQVCQEKQRRNHVCGQVSRAGKRGTIGICMEQLS